MKILIYGAGVQGSFLAHILDEVKHEHDVTILARGKRAEQLRNDGVVIRHYFQRKTTINKIDVVEELKTNDFYDIIFVTMKYNDFENVLPILAQNISENIVLVGNNMSTLKMQEYINTNSTNKKTVVFGFQVTGGIRTEDKVVAVRFDGGEMKVGDLTSTVIKPDFKFTFENVFKNTKYKITYEKDIDTWLKNHGAMIPAMTYTPYIKGNDFKAVAKDKELLKEAAGVISECYDILEASGYELVPQKQADFFRNHKNRAYWFLKLYYSLPLSKIIAGDIREIDYVCEELQNMKDSLNLNLPTPNLDSLKRKAYNKKVENVKSIVVKSERN